MDADSARTVSLQERLERAGQAQRVRFAAGQMAWRQLPDSYGSRRRTLGPDEAAPAVNELLASWLE